MEDTRPCPYCGETIRTEAIRCRHCRARLTALDPERWHRDLPERRVAGVAAAVARALAIPVGVARVGFVALSFFHLLGPVLYGALWLIVPFTPGGEAPLAQAMRAARELGAHLRARCDRCRARETRPHAGAERANGVTTPPAGAGLTSLPAHPLP